MADTKISDLTAATSVAGTDTFPIVQSATTKEAEINDILNIVPVYLAVACSDETTALTTGTAKVTFRMPFGMVLTDVRASLTTAGTGAALVTVDINEGGVSVLSTKITLDATEKTSTTAATPAVISDSALADDAEITIDIDQIDTGGVSAGLKVYLIGTRTAV